MKITDVVFTNHSIERMKERGISGDYAWQTVKQPDEKIAGKEKFTTEFIKKIDIHTITVIAKKNEIGEWVVLSVWMDPPLPGTKDHRKREKYLNNLNKMRTMGKKMQGASPLKKLWLTFRKQIGI